MPREDGSVTHRPPEGRAGGEETDTVGQFRTWEGQCAEMVRRRDRYVEEYRPGERVKNSRGGDGGPADLKKTQGQGHEHLSDTSMPVRNGNFGTEIQQQRLQVCENHWVRKIKS